jgi:4-carboxymuconolactone decarboxylase
MASNRDHEELVRRLALNDEKALASIVGANAGADVSPALSPRTTALVRLAALVAAPSAAASYQWAVGSAFAAGADEEDIVGVLLAVAPIVGAARIQTAAPEVASALGCDVRAVE